MSFRKKKQTIISHFPNADTVAIIKKPKEFLSDIEVSIGTEIKHELVHYFNIDEGFEANDGQDTDLDMEYYKYLAQDVLPENRKYTRYVFLEKYAYKVLFCKDVFFADEQEYRILLLKEKIQNSKKYSFSTSLEIEIESIEDFFNKS